MLLKEIIKQHLASYKMLSAFMPWSWSRAMKFAKKENEIFTKLVNDPCEQNAIEYIEFRKTRPSFSLTFRNHPSVWAALREKWYKINKSDRISYEMKKAIMEDLQKQGLHLNNQKIIDNYKK